MTQSNGGETMTQSNGGETMTDEDQDVADAKADAAHAELVHSEETAELRRKLDDLTAEVRRLQGLLDARELDAVAAGLRIAALTTAVNGALEWLGCDEPEEAVAVMRSVLEATDEELAESVARRLGLDGAE
jgi:predicted RNA methylase